MRILNSDESLVELRDKSRTLNSHESRILNSDKSLVELRDESRTLNIQNSDACFSSDRGSTVGTPTAAFNRFAVAGPWPSK